MRVAFLEPYPHLSGGGQRTTRLLARGLRDRGVEVDVVVPAEGPFTELVAADGVDVHVVALPSTLATFGHRTPPHAALVLPRAWARLGRTWRTLRPDVVHAANLRGMVLCGPSARALGIPTAWHVHLGEPNPRLNRIAATLASATVVPSRAALAGLAGVGAGAVTVIANAVDPDALGAGDDPRPDRTPRLVTSARLTPQKGLDTLIEAIPLLLPQHPGLTLTIYGAAQDGYHDHASDLRRHIDAAGLGAVVGLAGAVDAPYRHYRGASAYVQPSRDEILPLAILEAMAAGLPVVATDVGGVADAVTDGRTGLLVPPDDPPALAAALSTLLADPARAARFGAAGRERARSEFSLDAMADRWMALLGHLR